MKTESEEHKKQKSNTKTKITGVVGTLLVIGGAALKLLMGGKNNSNKA